MNQITTQQNNVPAIDSDAIRKVLLHGDLSSLNPQQKDNYYMAVCTAVGLNHLTKPFDFIKFQGKEVMYANKGCAEQLRQIKGIGIKVVGKEKIDDLYVVTVEAVTPEGRTDSSTGAISISGLKGEYLANAMMKAETKAKRRVTLSICGLNMLDESEAETLDDSDVKTVKSEIIIETKKDEASVRTVTATVVTAPEPKKEPEQITFGDAPPPNLTREEIGKNINEIRKKLGWKPSQLGEFVVQNWNKKTEELSNDEMLQLEETIQRLFERGQKS